MMIPEQLRSGYTQFRQERFSLESERYRQLARGQKPRTMIIGCADSRVDPATIFSAGPGELFVVRNVAALVPPYEENGAYHGTSAAIEFAVTGLGVSNIVVLGHGLCGGVAAALSAAEQRPVGRFIGPWVELLAEARAEVLERTSSGQPELRQKALERMAIVHSLKNLMRFPFVADAVAEGRLALGGGWFSIAEGALEWFDDKSGVFEPVKARTP
jgi:carbonic anhydrase